LDRGRTGEDEAVEGLWTEMSSESPCLDWAAEEIAREMVRVHEDSFGRSATNLRVAIHDSFVAVVMDVELTPGESALARAGNGDAVRITREEFAHAIHVVYEAIVERAIGRRVESVTSRAAVESKRPWSVHVFLLAPPAGVEELVG
jgi:uncharacterized protein YbcI